MKTFKQLVNEVAAHQSPADKEFRALHKVQKTNHPVATEAQFKGGTKKDQSKLAHTSNETGMVDDVKKEQPIQEEEEEAERVVNESFSLVRYRSELSEAIKDHGSGYFSAKDHPDHNQETGHVGVAYMTNTAMKKHKIHNTSKEGEYGTTKVIHHTDGTSYHVYQRDHDPKSKTSIVSIRGANQKTTPEHVNKLRDHLQDRGTA